jgi:hypothetical protein
MRLMDIDTRVFQDIVAEFKNSLALHHVRLDLHVQNGVVTISGRVNSFAERKAVERAAKRVTGVKTLILEIRAATIPVVVTDTRASVQKDAARNELGLPRRPH